MINAVHDDVRAMPQVNTFWCKDLRECDLQVALPGSYLLNLKLPDALVQRDALTSLAIEDGVEDIQQKCVFIFMRNNHIIAVLEVLPSSPGSSFQSGNNLCVVTFPVIVGWLIFKDDEEPACDCLAGPNRFDEVVVVLLELPAFGVILTIHIPLNGIEVLADVSFLGEYLDLELHRADLHPACEGGYDVLLLPDTSQQEIDRFHLKDFDVPIITQMSDAVIDVHNRNDTLRCGGLAALLGRCLSVLGCFLLVGAFPLTPPASFSSFRRMLLELDAKLLRGLVGCLIFTSLSHTWLITLLWLRV